MHERSFCFELNREGFRDSYSNWWRSYAFASVGNPAYEGWKPELQRVLHLQPNIFLSRSILSRATLQPWSQGGKDHSHHEEVETHHTVSIHKVLHLLKLLK